MWFSHGYRDIGLTFPTFFRGLIIIARHLANYNDMWFSHVYQNLILSFSAHFWALRPIDFVWCFLLKFILHCRTQILGLYYIISFWPFAASYHFVLFPLFFVAITQIYRGYAIIFVGCLETIFATVDCSHMVIEILCWCFATRFRRL